MTILNFNGFIRDIIYTPCLIPELETYPIDNFRINCAKTSGVISLGLQNNLAFSQWSSPKRTRTYPFARIYNTYHLNSKKITVIPVIKDEGAGTSNNDRINFVTLSWMNLLNIYVILAWYDEADVVINSQDKITNQRLNDTYVREKILEISQYQMSALHWNTTHFEKDFKNVYLNAVKSYEYLAKKQNVMLHSAQKHLDIFEKFSEEGKFNIDKFKAYTLDKSLAAAKRESKTTHKLEYLTDGYKGLFLISNYLGGIYHLTADEVYKENDQFIIQESKNASKAKMPSIDDVKDGLFKLILFSNLDSLCLNNQQVDFRTQLKITGILKGSLNLPNNNPAVSNFCIENKFNNKLTRLLNLLNQETIKNSKLQIIITHND